MPFDRPARRIPLAAALAGLMAALPVLPVPVAAQSADAPEAVAPGRLTAGARFGAWTLACEAIAVGETACVLTQRLRRSSDNAFLADLMLFWDGTLEQAWLAARVPTGVYFPDGFTVLAEGEATGTQLVWQACSPELCEAALPLDFAALQELEEAEALRAVFRPAVTAEPLAFRISLEGGRAGLEALAEALSR